MRQWLQINMKAEDLERRIGEAIAAGESKLTGLEDRIKARDGDQPCDVRVEDAFASPQELETECRGWIAGAAGYEADSDRIRRTVKGEPVVAPISAPTHKRDDEISSLLSSRRPVL